MMETNTAGAGPASSDERAQEVRQNTVKEEKAIQAPVIRVEGLRKSYSTAHGVLTLFDDMHLTVQAGEMVAVVGQSGAGKSTLLHILGALDRPSAGKVYCASTNVTELNAREAATFRNREIGYVWQFHYLLPEFTAQENVAMPLVARGVRRGEAMAMAANWLKEVGLEERGSHRPGELSGGEQQRVALARALVNSPRVLLADEPTGDLDESTAGLVFELVARLHQTHRLTSILVTHNMELASRCSKVLHLEGGRLTPTAAPRANPFPGAV